MSEMVERVARQIQRALEVRGGAQIPDVLIRHVSVATIEAMREPTKAMLEARSRHSCCPACGYDGLWADDIKQSVYRFREHYTALIDEALK